MATVWIPSLMRDLTGGRAHVEVAGRSVREVLDSLDLAFPGTKARLCEAERLRADIAVSVDGTIAAEGMRKRLGDESEVSFLPALSGG